MTKHIFRVTNRHEKGIAYLSTLVNQI
ncbi:hypothetical protein DEU42_1141, partial [Flavobacterium sp. AG291]